MDILYFPISFIITLLLVYGFKKLALAINFVDEPNARKILKNLKPY